MSKAVNTSATQSAPVIRYAGFWVRFVAVLVDLFVVFIFLCFVLFLIMIYTTLLDESPFRALFGILTVAAVMWLFCFWYFGLSVASSDGATWGRRLVGIQVVRADGGRFGWSESIDRESAIGFRWFFVFTRPLFNLLLNGHGISFSNILIGLMAIFLMLVFFAINFYMIVFSKQRQSIHDCFSKTYVIYRLKNSQRPKFHYSGTIPKVAEAKRRLGERGRLGL